MKIKTDLCDHISRFPEVGASAYVRAGQKVLDKPQPNVVTHLVQLFVYFGVVAIIVLTKLCHDRSVRQCYQLRVDLINPRSIGVISD